MKTLQIEIYQYNELSEKSKEIAIQKLNYLYWNDGSIYDIIKDDCSLFDIKEKDKKFPVKNTDGIVIGNNRGELFYTTEGGFFIDCTKAMKINDYSAFYQWLKLDKNIIKKIDNYDIELNIAGSSGYYRKTTFLEIADTKNCLTQKQLNKIDKAQAIFDNHIKYIYDRILEQYYYMQTTEYFIESSIIDDYEFLENGEIY